MDAPGSSVSSGTDNAAVSDREMANAIRALAMDAVERAGSGHPGMPMGMADTATVLFRRHLVFDARWPEWPDRDRFVLSAGHGSMLLYAVLYLTGYGDMPLEELQRFRRLGSRTPGHPEYGCARGVETTTGPLGQGLGNAVGLALGERLLNARFGDELVDHRTYVLASDGDLMEGVSHEAASLAGHLGLGRLIVLYDDNRVSIDGPTALADSVDHGGRFAAYGWHVEAVDGHDPEAVSAALAAARASERPSLIACRTVIGYGAPELAGSAKTHGAPLGAEEVAGARAELGWPHAAFEVPAAVLAAWRTAGARGAEASAAWQERLRGSEEETRRAFERRLAGELPAGLGEALAAYKAQAVAGRPELATRKASQQVLEVLAPRLPELVGGSADLTGSTGTKVSGQRVVRAGDYAGSYVHYGVREHAMAAAMNGLALHGGLRPYGGTFLVFSDYCRPSLRLSALMGLPVVYVLTHDSIGLGEDGPTHQPVEHLAALRAVPGLRVLRPADAVETAECWELALDERRRPSALALTRQAVATVRAEAGAENLSALGAYILVPAAGQRQVTLLASGSEVALAVAARELLAAEGISAAVVSMPCWELFEEQPAHYRDEVLGPGALRVGIEAAGGFGWQRWLGADGVFVGLRGFGASAPYQDLYRHFEITPEAVLAAVKTRL